jgi:uncharacterized membrane protein YdbT with pleckstrin-like domain
VAFPDGVLAEDEELVLHLRPHGRVATGPVLLLVLTVGITALAWVMLPPNDGGHLAFGVVALIMLYHAIRYAVRPLMVWRCTHYVVTDERILLQDGVVARARRDVPLDQVNDHALTQSLFDRLVGCGTLTVSSIGDRAAVLVAVPHAREVQSTLYELIDGARLRAAEEDDEVEEPEPGPLPARRGLFGRRTAR